MTKDLPVPGPLCMFTTGGLGDTGLTLHVNSFSILVYYDFLHGIQLPICVAYFRECLFKFGRNNNCIYGHVKDTFAATAYLIKGLPVEESY